jgi:hypothetical protein
VAREIAHAESLDKDIFPLLLRGRPFFRLTDVQYENVARGKMPTAAFLHRLRAVTAGAGPTIAPTTEAPKSDGPHSVVTAPRVAIPADGGPVTVAPDRRNITRWVAGIVAAVLALVVVTVVATSAGHLIGGSATSPPTTTQTSPTPPGPDPGLASFEQSWLSSVIGCGDIASPPFAGSTGEVDCSLATSPAPNADANVLFVSFSSSGAADGAVTCVQGPNAFGYAVSAPDVRPSIVVHPASTSGRVGRYCEAVSVESVPESGPQVVFSITWTDATRPYLGLPRVAFPNLRPDPSSRTYTLSASTSAAARSYWAAHA